MISGETILTISPDAVVVADAILKGKITVGAGTIVHPKARIDAKDGEIIFGSQNIVEETAVIENLNPRGVMLIGNDNLFEIGSVCQSRSVGDCNVFGIKSITGPNTEIRCQLLSEGRIPPLTIIHFEQNLRKTASEKPSSQKSQAEFLRKLMPKYSLSIQNTKK